MTFSFVIKHQVFLINIISSWPIIQSFRNNLDSICISCSSPYEQPPSRPQPTLRFLSEISREKEDFLETVIAYILYFDEGTLWYQTSQAAVGFYLQTFKNFLYSILISCVLNFTFQPMAEYNALAWYCLARFVDLFYIIFLVWFEYFVQKCYFPTIAKRFQKVLIDTFSV